MRSGWITSLLVACAALSILAAPARAVQISLPQVTAAPGETVHIPVQVASFAPGDTLLSANFDIRFDPRVVDLRSVVIDRKGALASTWIGASNARLVPGDPAGMGQVLVGLATASAKIFAPGVFFYLDVKVADSAAVGSTSPLRIEKILLNNGSPTAALVHGQLTVALPSLKADFVGSPQAGEAPLDVSFEDRSSEGVTSWLWNFGDGGTSTLQNPRHLYESAGQYTVSLAVSGPAGNATETKENYISVTGDQRPPDCVEGPSVSTTHNAATLSLRTNEPSTVQVQYCGLKLRPVFGNLDELIEALREEMEETGDLPGDDDDDDDGGERGHDDDDKEQGRGHEEGQNEGLGHNRGNGETVRRWLLHGELPHFIDHSQGKFPLIARCAEVVDETLALDHEISLRPLTPFTVYIYRVRVSDEAGNTSAWKGGYFVTRARPDDEPPILFELRATPARQRALVTWQTNEPANSFVQYSTNENFQNDTRVLDDKLVLAHEVWLENLQSNTLYHYRVRSTDASGNASALRRGTFRTGGDIVARLEIISGPQVTMRTPDKARIEWKTSAAASSLVQFGTGEEYGRVAGSERLVQEHEVLLTHLDAQTLYHFRVVSRDANGQEVASNDETFVTRGKDKKDKSPPGIVSAPHLTYSAHDRATVAVEADEACRGFLEFGTTEAFGRVVEIGQFATRHPVTLTGLAPGTTYFARFHLVDLEGNGPTTSRVFEVRTSGQRDSQAPLLIGAPVTSDRTDTQVSISWRTDEAADSFVEYGTDQQLGLSVGSPVPVKEHSVRLTGLQPGATYFFRVRSTDPLANGPTTSALLTFSTLPAPDRKMPVLIAGPAVVDRSHNGVVIQWESDEISIGAIEFGSDLNYGQEIFVRNFGRVHRVRLPNLLAGSTYHCRVLATDASGNGPTTSRDLSFTTRQKSDEQAPEIWGVSVRKATSNSALLEWQTSETGDSFVELGTTTAYGRRFEDATPVRQHHMLVTGLQAGTTYQFRVGSRDMSGNAAASRNFSLQTVGQADTEPPVVMLSEIVAGGSVATFVFTTNEPSFATVVVGTEETLGTPAEKYFASINTNENHRITVTGLELRTRYLFAIRCSDLSGNTTVLGEQGRRSGKVVRPLAQAGAISFTTEAELDFKAPAFVDGPRLVYRGDTQVLVEWTTDELGDSRLSLEEDGKMVLTEFVPEHVFEHRVRLGGLEPGKTYRARVSSSDPAGNGPTQSEVFTFTTSATADRSAPQLVAAPQVIEVGDRMATIVWETDEASSSEVLYGADKLERRVSSQALVTRHRVELTGLEPGKTYRFRTRSYDARENGPTESQVLTLKTLAAPDRTPPQIAVAPQVESVSDRRAVIVWETDEAADGFVHYGLDESLGKVSGRGILATRHRVELTGLEANKTYRFRALSADRSGNGPAESQMLTLTTLAAPDRTPPPAPQGLVARRASGEVLLSWQPAAAADVAGYKVYRASLEGAFALVAGPLAQTSYRDPAARGEFRYRVTAVDRANPVNESQPSLESLLAGAAASPGDLNGDGVVNFADFFILAERFGLKKGDSGYEADYDLNGDGLINFADFFSFVDLFGTSYGVARPVQVVEREIDLQPELRVAPGARAGEFAVEILARGRTDMRGWGLRVQYEEAGARFAGAEVPGAAPGGVFAEREGEISLGGFLPGGAVGEGVLARLYFQVAPGSAPQVRLAEMLVADSAASAARVLLAPGAASARLVPTAYALEQNFPNPFNPQTQIRFQLPQAGSTSLRIYDVLGREVAVLVDGPLSAGFHHLAWDGRDAQRRLAASGVYFYVLESGSYRQARKLLLLR